MPAQSPSGEAADSRLVLYEEHDAPRDYQCRFDGKVKAHDGARSRCALDDQTATALPHDLEYGGEPEALTTSGALGGHTWPEHRRQQGGRDTLARVGDLQRCIAAQASCAESEAATGRHRVARVDSQVEDDLIQPDRIQPRERWRTSDHVQRSPGVQDAL